MTDEKNFDTVVAATDIVAIETYHFEDSTRYAYIDANVSMPAGESKAVKLMRDSLLKVLDKSFAFDMEGERLVKPYTNADARLKAILFYYCKPALRNMSKDARYTFEDMNGNCEPTGNDYSLTKTYEDDRMVIFTETGCFMASGAAHPSSCAFTYTFNKHTGKLVSNFLKPGSAKKMQKLLIRGLVHYFKECGENEVNAANIFDSLQLPDGSANVVPLPQFAPTPGKDGLCFTYQQYEIACYAVGMPSFTLSYKELAPYLTDEAKKIFGM